MIPEVCKQCGEVFDPIEVVDGVCWRCMEHEERPRLDWDELYQLIEKPIQKDYA
jgi:methionyl-tRNA synthetase